MQNEESTEAPPTYMSLKEHKQLRHGRDVPPEAQLQYLKPGILAQALVHHKFVFTLPRDVRGDETDLQVMASHAFATNRSWGAPGTGATPDKPHAEVV